MKLRIEISDDCTADEVIIHCKEKDEIVSRLEAAFTEIVKRDTQLALFDGSSEYYVPMRDILFLNQTADQLQLIRPTLVTTVICAFASLKKYLTDRFFASQNSAL